jgi:hypothetical protein
MRPELRVRYSHFWYNVRQIPPSALSHFDSKKGYLPEVYCRASAVSVAVQFLSYFHPGLRRYVRKMVLTEDQRSVSQPYNHADGLITFLRHHKQMRVERRVILPAALNSAWSSLLGIHPKYPSWKEVLLQKWCQSALVLQGRVTQGSFSLVFVAVMPLLTIVESEQKTVETLSPDEKNDLQKEVLIRDAFTGLRNEVFIQHVLDRSASDDEIRLVI